ncbi:ROK family transcriptional regulator [Amycolatopsis balhimycina]|uniref:ROK family transcriptional regulator n=1 Tax=Amycolatopsis balhimycina TaxID=208443 RepID=UPI001FE13391|nr:ROK family transcriptional regulator [Amycolatopsis balhimycina]
MSSGTREGRAQTAAPWPQLPEAARQVLLEVLVHGPISRAEIAARLQVSRPTLSRITRQLFDDGLLAEGGTQLRSTTGRPSELLHVNGAARHFFGVKLTGDHLYAVVTDLNAEVVASVNTPLRSADVTEVVGQIAEVASALRTTFPDLTAAGVTLAGTVRAGSVHGSAYLHWSNVPLADLVAEATGLPTAVDNDVQALTAAEHWFGAGAGLRALVLVTIGVGIGCGLVLNGELVEGAHGTAGRAAHLVVDQSGPVCDLGHRGCAASYLLNESIVRALGAADYADAVAQARAGEPAARRVFGDAGFALGIIIGTVANLVDPQKVVPTGDGLPLYEVAADRVREGIEKSYEPDPAQLDLDVQAFDFGEWARSGAALAIRAALTGRTVTAG